MPMLLADSLLAAVVEFAFELLLEAVFYAGDVVVRPVLHTTGFLVLRLLTIGRYPSGVWGEEDEFICCIVGLVVWICAVVLVSTVL